MHDLVNDVVQRVYTYEPTGGGPAFVWSVGFSQSGERLAVGCWNHKVYVYPNSSYDGSSSTPPTPTPLFPSSPDDGGGARFISPPAVETQPSTRSLVSEEVQPLRCPAVEAEAEFRRNDRVYSAMLTADGERLLVGG